MKRLIKALVNLFTIGVLFLIVILATLLFHTTVVYASEPLSLPDIQPPPVIEGESYKWSIPVQGGRPPFRFRTTAELPPGLLLDTEDGIIYGITNKCINQASYSVKIEVYDRWNNDFWRIYTFKVVYKVVITARGAQFDEETNVYIDGNIVGKLKSSQNLIQYVSSGKSHDIYVDDNVKALTDNNTRYVPTNRYATVFCFSPNAEFIYNKEYLINITTDPPEVVDCIPYYVDWIRDTCWYKEKDTLKITARPEEYDGNGTKYVFKYWSLPGYGTTDKNTLDWQVTRCGDAVAHYKTYFWLDTDIPSIVIEGGGWKEKNSYVRWNIKDYALNLSPGIGAFLNAYLVPDKEINYEYYEYMDKPKTVQINWRTEWRPAIGSLITGFVLGVSITLLVNFLYKKYSDNKNRSKHY